MILYDIGLGAYSLAIKIASSRSQKARLWCEGREGLFQRMRAALSPSDRIVWVHAASLGEFEQGRPIIESLREQLPEHKILLTFFSPSGYELRKNYTGADYVFYLPLDTQSNAREFLDIVRPEVAIFVKYEFWLNLLFSLRDRGIKSYIISAIFREKSIFFRWWGGLWRKALRSFERLFVQNEESRILLEGLGFQNVIVAGDTRFDRVASLADSSKSNPIVAEFCGEQKCFIAGSSWHDDDVLLAQLSQKHPDKKFVIAPHEVDEPKIESLKETYGAKCVRYTELLSGKARFEGQQVLIIDIIGILSSLYQYGDISYIGGGFGVGIHNTLEAATFGLPVAFGPNYSKFQEAKDLISLSAARSISNIKELEAWYEELSEDAQKLARASKIARCYVNDNLGATDKITKQIIKDLG